MGWELNRDQKNHCGKMQTYYHTLWFFFSFFNRNAVRNFFRLTVVDTKYCQIISRV